MKPFLTLHHPARAQDYYSTGLWRGETFYDLLIQHAQRRPDASALRDGRVALTWLELRTWVDAVAGSLVANGLVAGDRVSIWMSNRAEAVVMFLACSRMGIACNPSLHRTYTRAEVTLLLERLGSAALLTEPNWGADADPTDPHLYWARAEQLRVVYTPETFAPPTESLENPMVPPMGDADSVAYLAFTSGTTGEPKCVMHSANTLLANARDLARDWQVGADARILSLSPLSHHIAWVAVSQWLVAGCQFISDDPPAQLSRCDWIIASGATYVLGVPTHAMDILAEQRQRKLSRLGAVEVFYMAGSPIPPVVAQAFVEQGIKPQNVYGMTENSSHQYTHPDDTPDVWIHTTGRGGQAYEVAIVDPQCPQTLLPVGETGEIVGRGAALMLGYYGNQRATQSSFNADGWFMSGDLGSLDTSLNLRVEGRLKDLIIRGGRNIYPAKIEALALRHPQIEKAAAFPIADQRLGERVCLAIIGTPAASEVLEFLAEQGLSKFDMPEFFLNVAALPLTASGKVLKRDLVEQVKCGQLHPESIRTVPPAL